MTQRQVRNPFVDDTPQAEVQRIGRFTYHVYVISGVMRWGPDGYGWHVWGAKRAERKAARVLAAYKRAHRFENTPRKVIA